MALKLKRIIQKGFAKMGYAPIQKVKAVRAYDAGKLNDLLSDFIGQILSPEEELNTLDRIRGRSRELVQNNDYGKNVMRIVKRNVVGWRGIRLQMKARRDDGTPDVQDNRMIEELFTRWGRKNTATVDGRLSWIDCQNLFIETVATDGECLVRKVPFPNEFRFSLQFIDIDQLDHNHNTNLSNGNRIRFGIEFDKWNRPVAYHIWERHPQSTRDATRKKIRIPAGEMIHGFIPSRTNQPRGVPWMHTAMVRLKMLGGYENSEMVASRIAAAKMGFIEQAPGSKYTGDRQDNDGNQLEEVEPGEWRVLKEGQKVHAFDPQHPNNAFGLFVKAMLRGAASGVGVSYNTLANDLEGVNFSSIRAGKLEERDDWRCIQFWMAENFNQEVYSGGTINFLGQALLGGPLSNIPFSRFNKFDAASWKPRGWAWVDPQKEVKAKNEEIQGGLTTRTRVLADQGIDFEELLDEIVKERELMKEKGVEFQSAKPAANQNNEPDEEEDDDEEKGDEKKE